jgi:hypothetical protein
LRNYLFSRFEAARSLAHAHRPKNGNIKVGVDATVVITAGWGDAPLSL